MGMTNIGQIRFSITEDKSPSPGGEGGLSSNNGTLAGGAGTYQAIVYRRMLALIPTKATSAALDLMVLP